MKTEIEIQDIFYNLIKGTTLAKSVTGDIYTDGRPSVIDSKKEDIIISINDSDNTEDKQTAFVYVNIYVADIKRGTDLIINKKRIRILAKLAIDIFESGITSDFKFSLTKQKTFPVESGEHCISNRIKLTHLNY